MFHCDRVPKSTDTVVSLRFSQGGREYTVERRIHFNKKRGGDSQYGEAKISALLWEPERDVLEGATKVTARCEALLGLNAEQFRKIIMLAQGEFREFLKADSDKKNEILGKLFDSAPYVWYQNLLAGARDSLRAERHEQREQLRALLQNSLRLPGDLSAEEAARFLPEHPALIESLQRLTEEDLAELRRLEDVRADYSRQIAALNTRKSSGSWRSCGRRWKRCRQRGRSSKRAGRPGPSRKRPCTGQGPRWSAWKKPKPPRPPPAPRSRR